ncbi:MAG: hypothetical protein ACRD5M_06965 [Candidatus Acidiferrales bacterium]
MNSRQRRFARVIACLLAGCSLVLAAGSAASAQVIPSDIMNPKLRAVEQTYLSHLQSLHHSIGGMQFPHTFVLTRYVGVDPDRQTSLDTRGLEFVNFQNRMLLKTSGFYSAAFDSGQLTQNERAGRTFHEVVVPILRLIVQELPPEAECDGIGFEIAYHVRPRGKNSEYEGREILAVVLSRDDALALANESGNEKRQEILDHSEIYVDGKLFGLALGQKGPINIEALERPSSIESASMRVTSGSSSSSSAWVSPTNSPHTPIASAPSAHASPAEKPAADLKPAASPADAGRLQAQVQPQLDALLQESGDKFHLVAYAPPSIAVYHKQLVLQLTLRNPLTFEMEKSSIYKRAAQTFDLFLAPELKALVPKLPQDSQIDALDFSILNRLGNEKDTSEAVEFVCPVKSIRAFVDDEITSQGLINQSLVLVNGVRVELHLEIVE